MKLLQEKYMQEVHGNKNFNSDESAKLLATLAYSSMVDLGYEDLTYALQKIIENIKDVIPDKKEATLFFIQVLNYIEDIAVQDNNSTLPQRLKDLTDITKHGTGHPSKIGLNEEEQIDPEDEVAIIKSVFYKNDEKPHNIKRKI